MVGVISDKFTPTYPLTSVRGIWYNRHMAKIEEGRTLWDIFAEERVGHCNRCEKGEHGIESKYSAGHCACCGTEVEYA